MARRVSKIPQKEPDEFLPLTPGSRIQVGFVHPFLGQVANRDPLVVIEERARRRDDLPGAAAE